MYTSLAYTLCVLIFSYTLYASQESLQSTPFSSQESMPMELLTGLLQDDTDQVRLHLAQRPGRREAPLFRRIGNIITPLGVAARNGSNQVTALLIEARAKHTPDEDGNTPLMHASQQGHAVIADMLAPHTTHADIQRAIAIRTQQAPAAAAADPIANSLRIHRDSLLFAGEIAASTGLPIDLAKVIATYNAPQKQGRKRSRAVAPAQHALSQEDEQQDRPVVVRAKSDSARASKKQK